MKHTLILVPEPDGSYKGQAGLPLDNPAGFDIEMRICKTTKKAILVFKERINR